MDVPEEDPNAILKPEILMDINNLWEVFITEGTDVVPIKELVTLLRALDVDPVNDDDINALVQKADPNNEGFFTKEALLVIMEDKLRDPDTVEALIEQFKLLDRAG